MAQVLWSAEGGSNGAGITTGNSGGASGDAFESVSLGSGASATYDNTQAHNGSLSAKLATGGSAADCSLNYGTAIGSQTTVYYRAYVYMTANPASNHRLIDSWDSGSGQLCFAIYLTTTGKLMSVNTAGSTIQTTTNSVNLSGWFRVEALLIGSATVGQVEVKLFNSPDSTTPTETITSAANQNTRGSANNFRFGASGDPMPASRTLWLDDLGISTTGYLGPTTSAVTLTPAAGTFAAVATTPTPQPVNLTLTPAGGTFAGVATTPAPGQVQRTLTPAAAGWSAVATGPTPGPAAVTLTPAASTFSGAATTPVPGPTPVTLTPAAGSWSAVPPTPVAHVALTPAAGTFAGLPLALVPGPAAVTLVPSAGTFAGVAPGLGGRITYRPNIGTTVRPDSGVTARP